MKKKIIAMALSVLMVVAVFSGCGSAVDRQSVDAIKKSGKLIMNTNAEFAPFEYVAGGKVVGVDVDIAQAIADKLGVELEINNVAFDTVLSAVSTGKASVGIAGITVRPDRAETVDFSINYTTSTQYIIVHEDFDVKTVEDLANKKIGVQLGTTGDFLISDEIKGTTDEKTGEHIKGIFEGTNTECIQFKNANLAATDLMAGKIDAVVIDKLPAELIVKNNADKGLKTLELVYADGSKTDEQYAVCVAKGNESLLKVINEVLKELIDSGKIDEFIIKHSTEALAD